MTVEELITKLRTMYPTTRVVLAIGDHRAILETVESGAMPMVTSTANNKPLYAMKAVVLGGADIDFGTALGINR